MKYILSVVLFALTFMRTQCGVTNRDNLNTDESQAEQYLNRTNEELAKRLQIYSIAQWNYATDINEDTSDAQINAAKDFNSFQKNQSKETRQYDWSNFKIDNQRQFEKLAVIGTSALEGEAEEKFSKVTNEMETIYSSATVCIDNDCGLELDPDLDAIMAESTDYDKLKKAWVNWRDASGKKMRDNYIEYYTLGNEAAKLNNIPTQNFSTLDELWLFVWETPDIKEQTADLWEQLKPLYKKVHAYVRMKLKQKYGDKMPEDGTIPAHLLGNMWAQQWSNIMNTVEGVDPYPEVPPIDVTQALQENYTPETMFRNLSEKFFTDLGLEPMTQTFWDKSVIEKKPNVSMVCHASAWDFYDGDDFRIKQCTSMNMEYLITTHHEMGHIQYFQQYKDQPTVYRDGANPGFHEAIGDLLALSVSTPKHLNKTGLLKLDEMDDDTLQKLNIKFQIKMALDKIVFLPFGYIMDKWRWDVFSGNVSSDDMNRHWWQLRGEYQGLSPPVSRSEDDFDPGAKYHIPSGVEYIRYFASHILQFQFHQKLCGFREKNVPLHECDIDGDRDAGTALKNMLMKGSSQKWTEQLKELTGSDKMDVQPLLDYFKPLEEFLDQQLVGQTIGWNFNVDDYFDGKPGDGSGDKDDSPGGTPSSTIISIFSLMTSVLITILSIIL